MWCEKTWSIHNFQNLKPPCVSPQFIASEFSCIFPSMIFHRLSMLSWLNWWPCSYSSLYVNLRAFIQEHDDCGSPVLGHCTGLPTWNTEDPKKAVDNRTTVFDQLSRNLIYSRSLFYIFQTFYWPFYIQQCNLLACRHRRCATYWIREEGNILNRLKNIS